MNRGSSRGVEAGMGGWLRLAAGLLLLGVAPVGAAAADAPAEGDACVEGAVAALQQRYESVEDLRAGFEQTSRSVALGGAGAVSVSRGTVVLAKPGRMRWEYLEPERSLVVSDGEWLWIYDPEAGEAQKLPAAGGSLSGAALQFLLGQGDLLRDFRVESEGCDAERASLVLWPREPASYEKLGVVAETASGRLLETRVVDLLGNDTRVAFQDVELNRGAAADLFRFAAPPGVEVIEIAPPEPR